MKKKILIPLVSVGLIGAIVVPVAVISATRKSGSKIEEAEFKNINSENVFPKLENDDIYQCIRYNGNDFWLDKSIIDKVVRYVSSNLQTNADTFDFSYKWINKYTIIFDFVVKSGVETYSHQYKIEAKM
ncbi:hypothetical protein MCFN_00340 [Mycoplasmopsis californica]|uniref:Uncharacterized protein n=2 Tax=Mycoplasmopsis californica TaxID=2113 RepID=A0A059XVK9_9BACT|nr:hypothetical protein [Mycoplasmopsis californica]AIA29247.1 hypothetical protein MCFN_00340 [Mycoplasmopsis californica]